MLGTTGGFHDGSESVRQTGRETGTAPTVATVVALLAREGYVHDVIITREAPNYQLD